MATPAATLPALGILAGLTDEDRADLFERGSVINYQKGNVVLEQGQPQGFLRYVLDGELQIATSTEYAIATLGYAHAGECVGEMSLLEGVRSMARVFATAPTSVWCLDRDAFERFCQEKPAAGLELVKGIATLLSRRLRAGDVRVVQAETEEAT
jgi:CRP/FNR family cyclic AMP-dependent transcriptional regulator